MDPRSTPSPRRRLLAAVASTALLAAPVAAGLVLAPPALAAASTGSTGSTGSYASLAAVDATAAAPGHVTFDVPAGEMSQVGFVGLTLHGLTAPDTTKLTVTLTSPVAGGPALSLACQPAALAGTSSPQGAEVSWASTGTSEAFCNGYDPTMFNGIDPTGAWTLEVATQDTQPAAVSGGATLELGEAPTVLTSPADPGLVKPRSTVTLTASASGVPAPTVQWQRAAATSDPNAQPSFVDVPDATGTSYAFPASVADDQAQYRAVFTNRAGEATSDVVYLAVDRAPQVTQQPVSQTVVAGTDAVFSAAADGPGTITADWQVDLHDGYGFNSASAAPAGLFRISADHSTLTVLAPDLSANGMSVRVAYSSPNGDATTRAARLTVTGAVPGAPTSVSAKQTALGSVTITWGAATSPGTPAKLLGYAPGYSSGQSGNGTEVAPSARSITFSHLRPGTYLVSVAAFNAAGDGKRVFVPVDVSAPVTTPTLGLPASAVYGASVRFHGSGPASSSVRLQHQAPGSSTWSNVTTLPTDRFGEFGTSRPAAPGSYRVVASNGTAGAAHAITIRAAVTVVLRHLSGRTYAVSGSAQPAHARQVVTVTFSKAGSAATSVKVPTSSSGAWSLQKSFPSAGTWTVKAAVGAIAPYAAGTETTTLTV